MTLKRKPAHAPGYKTPRSNRPNILHQRLSLARACANAACELRLRCWKIRSGDSLCENFLPRPLAFSSGRDSSRSRPEAKTHVAGKAISAIDGFNLSFFPQSFHLPPERMFSSFPCSHFYQSQPWRHSMAFWKNRW